MPYWNEGWKYRWEYMSAVIRMLKHHGLEKTLEMGTYFIPLNDESFLIELEKRHLVTGKGMRHDLNKTPYPFESNYFDCAIALQVWEHLDRQQAAFNELARISRYVILSLPYKWKHGDWRHKGIDDKKIIGWASGRKPIGTKLIRDRKIYMWRTEG